MSSKTKFLLKKIIFMGHFDILKISEIFVSAINVLNNVIFKIGFKAQ